MDDIKEQFKENFLQYASYVILDRAIPHVVDGLKPVQRRILWTLHKIDDGKLHKVANVAGQTMAYHPHGDAPITDALVNLANKNYLLDTQGNFGNPFTGDPAAASRYIETRLSSLAKETLFNSSLTEFFPSYDGRNLEPTVLPVKIPLLLMQGAEGIAVGMSTKIMPHNFIELLEGEIALLEGQEIAIYPDFLSGGIMDVSEYDKGRGKVKLRASIDIVDDKTLVIKEICYGTTTESLIRSIDEAAKRGKIKIDSINDYTAEKIEIEIKLPRGQYAKECLKSLYAFTDCEVSISTQLIVIKDGLPWETTVDEVLAYNVEKLKGYLQKELELEKEQLIEKIFSKTLEQIFIENRLYKQIEEIATYELIHDTIAKSLKPFHQKLERVPEEADRERLLSIPIRRISRFDIGKNEDDIRALQERLGEVEKLLKSIKRYTIQYLKELIKKYAKEFPRRTKIKAIAEVDKRAILEKKILVGYDSKSGFLGTSVSSDTSFECSNLDKLLVLFKNGSYRVMNIPTKEYVHTDSEAVWIGPADKKTKLSVIYKDTESGYPYAKRFIVKQFILEKEYRFLDESHKLEYITSDEEESVQLSFKPKGNRKVGNLEVSVNEMPLKGAQARGVRLATKELKQLKRCK
ncbi:MAG: DNA topoisomerase IV subunit A [Chlamydiales bacterium]|nr:DNA topoisomerase IV subunit A [Chlamydiales bacterium]